MIVGVALVISPFALKAWNGEEVPIPGLNGLIEAIRDDATEADEATEEATKAAEREGELSFSRMMLERDVKRISAFENADGYLVTRSDEEYKDLAAALSRFRLTSDSAKKALDEARGKRGYPLFFSIALGEAVEEEPFLQVVGTATIEWCRSREEAYPLPKGVNWFTVGANPLVTRGEIETPSFRTMREFVAAEIAPIVDSADGEALVAAAIAGRKADLEFFGVQTAPGIMSAKIWRTYKGETEERIPAVRFLPFIESRAISTHPAHAEVRYKFAEAIDLDPDRLEEALKGVVEKTDSRRALVTYWPHRQELRVEVPSAFTDVVIRVLSPESLWREAYRVASATMGVQASIPDLELEILEDLGRYHVDQGKKIHHHEDFPERFVCLTQESKSGVEGKIISYRDAQTLLPREGILNAAQLQAAIQRVLDQDPERSHFEFGCLQTREEIMDLFSQYQSGFENPADAFPCHMGYDYTTRRVIMFQRIQQDRPAETADAVGGEKPLASYGVKNFSEKSLKELREMIAEEHGITLAIDGGEARSLALSIIKAKGLPVKIRGDKIEGGHALIHVISSKKISMDVVADE
ncbi:MAG: hypothetical protein OXB96_01795 [Candidatus Kaiserbacteria bacterium]|nr:hypothetical protein [Candidatus Kaiserbacteria bacterium]